MCHNFHILLLHLPFKPLPLISIKRRAIILLTAIYLFSTLGVSAQSMYCMGVVRSTHISYGTTPKMATRMKHCCKTKKQLLRVSDQHLYSGTLDMLAKFFAVLLNLNDNEVPTCTVTITQQQLYYSHAPPTAFSPPAYMLNCNYRI